MKYFHESLTSGLRKYLPPISSGLVGALIFLVILPISWIYNVRAYWVNNKIEEEKGAIINDIKSIEEYRKSPKK